MADIRFSRRVIGSYGGHYDDSLRDLGRSDSRYAYECDYTRDG